MGFGFGGFGFRVLSLSFGYEANSKYLGRTDARSKPPGQKYLNPHSSETPNHTESLFEAPRIL